MAAVALSVDVEEWYHTCLVPDWVRPERRPPLPTELPELLPQVLDQLAAAGAFATFFILGEVAADHPQLVQRVAAAGHEVACHADVHLRIDDRPLEQVVRGVGDAKHKLEDLVGVAVIGFRAPEWSLRHVGHALLPRLVELGFCYDSSLAPVPGAGRISNPRDLVRLHWGSEVSLMEAPPLAWGPIPANGWTSRLRSGRSLARQALRRLERGRLATLVVHPWELSGRPSPGRIPGRIARWIHELGREGFRPRFARLVEQTQPRPLATVLACLVDPSATAQPSSGIVSPFGDAPAARAAQ